MKRASIAEITLTQQAKQEQHQIDKIDIEMDRLKFARDAHWTSKQRIEAEIARLYDARIRASQKALP